MIWPTGGASWPPADLPDICPRFAMEALSRILGSTDMQGESFSTILVQFMDKMSTWWTLVEIPRVMSVPSTDHPERCERPGSLTPQQPPG